MISRFTFGLFHKLFSILATFVKYNELINEGMRLRDETYVTSKNYVL